MLANLFADRINLDQRAVHGFGASYLARNPDGKENCAQIPFAHAWNVKAARGAARSQIELSVEEALRRVIVRIHDDGRKVQLARLLRNAVCFHCTRQEHASRSTRTRAQNRSHHSTSPCSPIEQPASLC